MEDALVGSEQPQGKRKVVGRAQAGWPAIARQAAALHECHHESVDHKSQTQVPTTHRSERSMMGMRPMRMAPLLFLPLRITTSLPLQDAQGGRLLGGCEEWPLMMSKQGAAGAKSSSPTLGWAGLGWPVQLSARDRQYRRRRAG